MRRWLWLLVLLIAPRLEAQTIQSYTLGVTTGGTPAAGNTALSISIAVGSVTCNLSPLTQLMPPVVLSTSSGTMQISWTDPNNVGKVCATPNQLSALLAGLAGCVTGLPSNCQTYQVYVQTVGLDSIGNPTVSAWSAAATPNFQVVLPPSIVCPGNAFGTSPGGSPVAVTFPNGTVTGGFAPTNVVSSPASGSSFAVGTTTVTQTVTDSTSGTPLTANCTLSIIVTQAGTQTLLTTGGFTCVGAFISMNGSIGTSIGSVNGFPMAYRYESGVRHWFLIDGTSTVYEGPEPMLSSCSTAWASMNQMGLESWGGSWGTFPNANAAGEVWYGLNYDSTLGYLVGSKTGTYVNLPTGLNTMVASTLNNSTHVFTQFACWAVTNGAQPKTGSGWHRIPSAWATANLGNANAFVAGDGGYLASVTSGDSLGLHLSAFLASAFTTNACATSTDYPIGAGQTLADYPSNPTGPNCYLQQVGCNPSGVPTNPIPANMAHIVESASVYPENWEPYPHASPTTNYYNPICTSHVFNWYDDGPYYGALMPYVTCEGWLTQSIAASPAPTIVGSTITFSLPSTSTNDGNTLNAGDVIVVQTCTPNVDPGCDNANGRQFSIATVNSATSTAVNATINEFDFGSGTHAPVIGGNVTAGCYYVHAAPRCTRYTLRFQIYDPADFIKVKNGQIATYALKYKEDVDASSWFPQTGCPSCMTKGASLYNSFVGVQVDPSTTQFMVIISNAKTNIGVSANVVYVFQAHP
jgi:hypothetical protein